MGWWNVSQDVKLLATYQMNLREKDRECFTSSKPVIPNFPRPVSKALFRLLTGHDCLNEHLLKIRLKDTSVITLCNSRAGMANQWYACD
ncbi:hypothetical protein TNCV_18241 [Trichonephila clavipes]|nr:hypothetical protein TNCV_18241 [Trichonephila clavipes]